MNSTLLKLDWTVEDFAKCKSPGDRLESDFFEPKNDNLIYLKMHPNGFLDSQHDVYIIVYFHYCKFPEMNVLYKFSLIDNQGKPMYTRESKGIYRENSEYGFPEYICRSYITEKANELLVDGKLRIYCELHLSPIEKDSPSLSIENQLVLDYTKFWKNSKFYDVILCFGEKELKAHKDLLSARSPVFEAMFSHDLSEARQNRVNISDVSVDGFEVLLKYIYTGQVELNETFAAELLVASDKYGFEILKCQCEQWICSQLENDQTQSHVSSIVDLLLMADMQSAEKLKIESIKYIVKNSNLVTSAGKLAKLMQTKPELFNEVFNLMAQKLNDLDVLDNLKIK